MIFHGKAHVFGDNISADYIISAKYLGKTAKISDLIPYVFEDIQPDFFERVIAGDIIVAGDNFGAGSSREHAAQLLKVLNVGCVVARSFGRNFFRNAANHGLPLVEMDWNGIEQGDSLSIDLNLGVINNETRSQLSNFKSLPPIMAVILRAGGLIPYFKMNKTLPGHPG
ncbi:MAG: 3-isopropylmalate dehydratase [Negativicutes bacterium]|nr:3-isopropylmalate dehydratase [Negativicutes bacterium]